MFSGIIESLGTVRARTPGRIEIVPRVPFDNLEIGESIAVNGACLTVASVSGEAFAADVMPETWHRTTLGELTGGATVNLERALRLGDRVSCMAWHQIPLAPSTPAVLRAPRDPRAHASSERRHPRVPARQANGLVLRSRMTRRRRLRR